MVDTKMINYLERLETLETSEQVWAAFIEESVRLGVPAVSYGFRKLPNTIKRDESFTAVESISVDSNSYTWVTTAPKPCIDYWISRHHLMEKIDPMVDHIRTSLTPLMIGNEFLRGDDPFYEDRKALYDVGEANGVYCGYGIPLKQYGTSSLGEIVYHTPYQGQEFQQFIARQGPLLHMLAHYMHMMFQPLERKERAISMGIKGRPLEVLHMMREGLTNAEIAHQLDLSPATISFHIKDLKERLNASSTRDIVPMSIMLNLLAD